MQAVILAAGLGTRMGELTKRTPKPLLKIGDQNLLERNLENLPPEIKEVVLVIGYLGGQIRKHFGNKWRGRTIRYVEQKEPKGTAHALFICQELLEDRFLVLMGDDLYAQKRGSTSQRIWATPDYAADGQERGKIFSSQSALVAQSRRAGGSENCGQSKLTKRRLKLPYSICGPGRALSIQQIRRTDWG